MHLSKLDSSVPFGSDEIHKSSLCSCIYSCTGKYEEIKGNGIISFEDKLCYCTWTLHLVSSCLPDSV